jgi:hypothetical protein
MDQLEQTIACRLGEGSSIHQSQGIPTPIPLVNMLSEYAESKVSEWWAGVQLPPSSTHKTAQDAVCAARHRLDFKLGRRVSAGLFITYVKMKVIQSLRLELIRTLSRAEWDLGEVGRALDSGSRTELNELYVEFVDHLANEGPCALVEWDERGVAPEEDEEAQGELLPLAEGLERLVVSS